MEERCWMCGGPAPLVTEDRRIPMRERDVVVEDRFYRCTACGEEFYGGGMMDETLQKAASTIQYEDGLLGPDAIRAIRASYGLTQAGLETLINAGEKTVVRWERGTVAQNATADTLLRVLRDHPEVVAKLADERGVKLRAPKKTPKPDASGPVDGGAETESPREDVRHAA